MRHVIDDWIGTEDIGELLVSAHVYYHAEARFMGNLDDRRDQILRHDLPILVAEVVRDLYRSERQPEQSYSERQLYEAALDRMAREIAAVNKYDEASAIAEIEHVLENSASRIAKDPETTDEAEKAA